MTKCIQIDSCKECPHKGRTAGLGSIPYRPLCLKHYKKPLAYIKSQTVGKAPTYELMESIPTWCPLDDYHTGS